MRLTGVAVRDSEVTQLQERTLGTVKQGILQAGTARATANLQQPTWPAPARTNPHQPTGEYQAHAQLIAIRLLQQPTQAKRLCACATFSKI